MNTTIEEQVARYSRAVTATRERSEATTGAPRLHEYALPSGPRSRSDRSIWAVAALFVALVALAAGAAIIAGGATSTDLAGPADGTDEVAAADELLDAAVGLVEEGRADGLCAELAASETFCHQIYDDLDPARVPTTPPQVAGARTIDGEQVAHAYVLTVCGVDGLGAPYVSDFAVLSVGDGVFAVQSPVYWSGLDVRVPDVNRDGTAGGSVVGPSESPSDAAIPDGCPTGS